MELTALIFLIGFIIWLTVNWKKKINISREPISSEYRIILQKKVSFYENLNNADKQLFETRIQRFIAMVKITGINTIVEPLDIVLVAASAIIPIFSFKNWEYNNLNEVLLYPDAFNEAFNIMSNREKPILGMVGNGAMQQVMILSKTALREGFDNKTDKNNTGIHEFVHLIDKTDGEIDGVPEYLLNKQYLLPWINMMHKNIKEILADNSDINPYGATNKAEFFAVASEYFFKRPGSLKIKHPELYGLLEQIFKNNNIKTEKKKHD